jgi:hypothetical protein
MLKIWVWHLAGLPHREGGRIERLAENPTVGGISERHKEIKRRRHRRKKLAHLQGRLKKATVSEKAVIATKIRNLTPGAELLIERWGLAESNR